jgi:hypothetical protein
VSPARTTHTLIRPIRWLPFAAAVAVSMWVAAGASRGHKAFAFDLGLSADSLVFSLSKAPHYVSMALIFVLAIVAVGMRRPIAALGLTMLVGLSWEIAEATALGHTARAADLVPDMLAALACLALLLIGRRRSSMARMNARESTARLRGARRQRPGVRDHDPGRVGAREGRVSAAPVPRRLSPPGRSGYDSSQRIVTRD